MVVGHGRSADAGERASERVVADVRHAVQRISTMKCTLIRE